MRIVVAPDSMGGRLSATAMAAAVVEGWIRARPDDDVHAVPMSDGGEGLLDVTHGARDTAIEVEVAGPLGHPVDAWLSRSADGATAIVESAQACGLARVAPRPPDPMRATTWGVGQLLEAALDAGVRRVLVGLGGSATVEGGAGALSALGFRVTVADGSGLKVGAADLPRVASVVPGWRDPRWDEIEVVVLVDVDVALGDAAARFGPQKGARPEDLEPLAGGLRAWAEVVERDLSAAGLREQPGTGAAGGLGFGLVAALGGRFERGAAMVADLVGLDAALRDADLVVTGEGALDATSWRGKVVSEVVRRADEQAVPVAAIVGRVDEDPSHARLQAVERAAAGPDEDVAGIVAEAATRLARGIS